MGTQQQTQQTDFFSFFKIVVSRINIFFFFQYIFSYIVLCYNRVFFSRMSKKKQTKTNKKCMAWVERQHKSVKMLSFIHSGVIFGAPPACVMDRIKNIYI